MITHRWIRVVAKTYFNDFMVYALIDCLSFFFLIIEINLVETKSLSKYKLQHYDVLGLLLILNFLFYIFNLVN